MSRYRQQDNGGRLFAAIEHQQAVGAKTSGILKLRDIIDWESFRPLIEELTGYAKRDWTRGGKPPFDPVFMLKVLVLQKYHGLSDDATEEQIFDRCSFKNFLGLRIGDELPDAKTIWDFKQRIEADGRQGARQLFEAFGKMLESQGLVARQGSIIDASFVDAPRQRNTREQNQSIKNGQRPEDFDTNPAVGRQKDSEARWTKKNQETHYGWKNHAKVDAKSKLILKSTTTPAHVHDSQVFEELLDQKDKAVIADSAYHSEEHEAYLLKINAEEFLMRKATRNHPLPIEEEERNGRVSRIRVRVEHVFARLTQMGNHICRSIGLQRAQSHNHLANLVYNMDRYAYLVK